MKTLLPAIAAFCCLFHTAASAALSLSYNTGGTRINVNRNATPGSSMSATGGIAPYQWILEGGSLPPGISLNSDGTFAGSSTTVGVHAFTARATDALGVNAAASFILSVNAARQGTVQTVSFTGPVTGATVSFSLYLPPGYSDGSDTYPVIYHLHGIGGTHNGGQINTVPVSHESAVSAGLMEPCVIVFPDGYNDSFWADAVNAAQPAETNIMQEIIPHVEAGYRVRPGGAHRVIQGYSMGGFGAAKFAAKFPEQFACCAIYDGAMLNWTLMQQQHAAQTVTVFDSSQQVYNQFSAYHWIIENAATLRVSMPVRNAVGNLLTHNQNWQNALAAQNIPATFIHTGLPHSLGPLLDAQGANMWEFIAEGLDDLGGGDFTFTVNSANNTFAYSDAERSFGGIFVKPAGDGPFPAVIINHGQGGSPAGYSLGKASQMAAWGMVCIGPELTHVLGGETAPATTGHCPENEARGVACLNALVSLGYVDPDRIAIFGHSKGAYAAIGQVAALTTRLRAAGMSAGGIVPDSAGTGVAAPTHTEAGPIRTPFIMFHGETDPAVAASTSLAFKNLLDGFGVPNQRHLYDVSSYSPSQQHNIHQIPDIDADMMTKMRAWFTTHGMFGFSFGSSQGGLALSGASGALINVTLTASGGVGPYTWTVIGGALPAGVSLSADGTLAGTPASNGGFEFTVRATDANDATSEQTFTLTVAAPPTPEPEPRLRITLDGENRPNLEWDSIPGAWYQVEVSEDLVHWSALGAASVAAGESTYWQDAPLGSPPPRRFYRVRGFGVFTVNVSGNSFTYTDTQRSVTGILRKPAGDGPFPAVIINHGTGGSAGGYAGARANEMLPWGLVCIGANLTHQDTGAPDTETGHSPENHARIEACLAVLASRGYVDMNRVAMFGNSRGSFTAVGSASLLRSRIKAIGICAGGVLEDGDSSDVSYPSVSESSGITAPTLIFHGSNDTVVPPANSLRLQTLLSSLGVPNNRILHATTGTASHNLHQDATVWPQVLGAWQAWLVTHGVLP